MQRGGHEDQGDPERDAKAFATHYRSIVTEAVDKTIEPVTVFLKAMWAEKALTKDNRRI